MPLVEIGGRSVLWHIMKSYAHYGFSRFVICLGYRGNMIKDYFPNYDAMNIDFSIGLGGQGRIEFHGEHDEQDLQVTLADTGQATMTGGRVRRVRRFLGDATTFHVTYGDGLCDVDIRAVVNFHRRHGKVATLTAVRPTSWFGLLGVEDDSRVSRFAEKPAVDGWANAGFFVFDRKLFNYLDGDDCILRSGRIGRVQVARGDCVDQALTERILGEHEVRSVFHLAAQTIVGIADGNTVATFEANIEGSIAWYWESLAA